ncbi:MAG: hypothetical protein JRJ12_00195 [Deltaproteobacteria bacterium]|nr:hypothetical protein [Deltaproteobacteria bacterium]MBW2069784.1 hypothetical protein [Deltaproteobacteria bacterium]
MSTEQLQQIVTRVISKLVSRLEAGAQQARVIAVFSAATVNFEEAIQQVLLLPLAGYGVEVALSAAAEQLYGGVLRKQLAGLPLFGWIEPGEWLVALRRARAVVVPLLSVNTLSKVCLLVADSLASNLILHGLFMGKEVIAARNGADPLSQGRQLLGFAGGTAALEQALQERLQTIADYGCYLTDMQELTATVAAVLGSVGKSSSARRAPGTFAAGHNYARRIICASDILRAHRQGEGLLLAGASLLTPLARDLAKRYGIALEDDL